MSKYNFEMDLDEGSSIERIVKKLKQGMTVLEFGCSYGRMTRYMKEELDCTVYIIEYDSAAYESASRYAKDGVCGDIQKYEWVTKFKEIRFDAIIIADVLEHLTEPVKVLKTAGNMLADDGKIFISIPNITHNDIILKSCMDRFDYTDVGLLDDTHVHFWGLDNLEDLAKDSDLCLKEVEATYRDTGSTEQFSGTEIKSSKLLLNILNERKTGQVYQFIITMQKSRIIVSDGIYRLNKPYIYSHIYLDRGQGFDDRYVIPVKAFMSEKGLYHVNYRTEDTRDLRCIRFDPVELQGCLIKRLDIRQGTKLLSSQFSDSVDLGKEMLIKDDDPQIIIPVEENGEPVSIDSEFILRGDEYIDSLEEWLSEYKKETMRLKKQLDEKIVLLGSYHALADSKDTYIVKLERLIAEKEKQSEKHSGKIFIAKVLRGLKRRIRTLVR